MPNPADLGELTRGQLIALQSKLVELATEAKERESELGKPSHYGTQRDPLVRRLASLALYELKETKGLTYQEIGDMFGVTRERAHQLYKQLLEYDPEEIASNVK